MLISVIVPLYHGKKYISGIVGMVDDNLREAKSNFEIELIFVNDCPDELISENDIQISEMINPILLNNEKNCGIHYSRVKGLNKAKGEYILFFDQDDRIRNDYFESQLKHIGKADVVVANGIAQYPEYDKMLYRYWFMQWTVKHIWFYAKFDCRIISPGQCLIKRDCIPAVWKENILENNGADDYFLWLELLSKRAAFAINREKLYTHVYTFVNSSLDNEKMRRSVKEVLDKQQDISNKYCGLIEKRIMNKNKTGFVRLVERINRVY